MYANFPLSFIQPQWEMVTPELFFIKYASFRIQRLVEVQLDYMCLETHSEHHIVKQERNMLGEYIWFIKN